MVLGDILWQIVLRDSMTSALLCSWQETLFEASLDPDFDLECEKYLHRFNVWKHCYLKTCAAVDEELEHHRKINTFHSGTTALTILKTLYSSFEVDHHFEGDIVFLANVGDSRAVLSTNSDDGSIIAVQLTVDFKPNLPHKEAERIIQCNGRVYCLADEPGVHRVWLPPEDSPGLAMSRAFGDYCIKDFGLISMPEVTHRHITSKDQFIVQATDGVWDVASNEEAVQIVLTSGDRANSAKRLV